MSLTSAIAQLGGPAVVEKIAEQFGLEKGVAAKAIGMMLPSISSGIKRNLVKDDEGLAKLIGALAGGDHQKYVDDPQSLTNNETKTDGNGILGHVLKTKDASRAVAETVGGVLGIDSKITKQMLPQVAAVTMGGLAKQTHAAGLHTEQTKTDDTDLMGQLSNMLEVGDAGDVFKALFEDE